MWPHRVVNELDGWRGADSSLVPHSVSKQWVWPNTGKASQVRAVCQLAIAKPPKDDVARYMRQGEAAAQHRDMVCAGIVLSETVHL